jgi:hypothetical protein
MFYPLLKIRIYILSNPSPYRQLVGKTRWVFRQLHGKSSAWFHIGDFFRLDDSLDWTHSADGRPSGSSLQAVEQEDWINPKLEILNFHFA